MSHYYVNDDTLDDKTKELAIKIKGIEYKFLTKSGVFSKNALDFGSKVLIESIKDHENIKTIADIGCGYGPIGLSLANQYNEATVYMYDINERAVELATKNAQLNKIKNVEIKTNNILENVTNKFDLIVTNPPIRVGKEVVFKIYEQSFERLNNGGYFYCVIQKKQGAPSSFDKIKELFKNATKVVQVKGYWIISAKKM